MNDFFNQQLETLERLCVEQGKSPIHAHHIFKAAYASLDVPPWAVEPIPKILQNYFAYKFSCSDSRISEAHISSYDSSVKFVIELKDWQKIECVLMPESNRMTICLSSQVGCRQGCVFCSTGRMGLRRNLSAGEIVSQVILVKRWIRDNPEWQRDLYGGRAVELSNIVFMGMGEPLDNVEAIIQAINIFCQRKGFSFAKRRISVSTAGHLDGLRRLLAAHPTVSVAISLHASNDSKRSRLMPINRRWNLNELMLVLDEIAPNKAQGVLIQYTLINSVNDTAEDAQKIAKLLRGKNVKVNLIPFNDVDHSRFRAPEFSEVQAFRDILHGAGLRTMVRYSKGQDISAACGQLVK